jgi:YD repeat-containing protein
MVDTATGQLAVLNRKWSLFSNGWWLSGLEWIYFQDGNIVWAGGDGSVRVYEPDGSNLWRTNTLTRPDSIVWNAGLNRYVRRLPDGRQVRFATNGRHFETVSRHGDVTTFTWGNLASGPYRLLNIKLPLRSGQLTAYEFYYDEANPTHARMDSVVARDLAGGRRVTRITHNNLTRIQSITDPDGEQVTFNEYGVAYNIPRERVDKMGHTVRWDFEGYRVTSAHAYPGTGVPDTIVTTFRPAEILGLSIPVNPAAAYAMVDGPRNVADSTRFKVDRYGQPTKVIDGMASVTELERANSTFPGLVTRMEYPNGRVLAATYDAHGHLLTSSDSSTSPVATTSYEWNHNWSAITKITLPEGEVTEYSIDATNGNRLWQQDSRGSSSRVYFHYANADSSLLAMIIGAVGDTTLYRYDSAGRIDSVITPSGLVTAYTNDPLGRPVLVKTPIDTAQTAFRYDSTKYDVMDRVTHEESWADHAPYETQSLALDSMPSNGKVLVNHTYDDLGRRVSTSRKADPDPNGIGWVATNWRYDVLGRVMAEENPGGQVDSTAYDAAGNAVELHTSLAQAKNTGPITMSYDALGRVTQRVVPELTYASQSINVFDSTWVYPRYPNDGTSWTVEEDQQTFTYDAMGNVLTANNRDAQVSRTYFPNGAVKTDTLRLREYATSSFSSTRYGLAYSYDRNGRRSALRHPYAYAPQGSGMSDSVRYVYNVSSVSGPSPASISWLVVSIFSMVASPSPWLQPGLRVGSHSEGYAALFISSIHNF